MGLRTIHSQPCSHLPPPPPSTNSSLPDALAVATAALSPWLSSPKHRPLPRELRTLSTTLTRLRDALALAANSSVPLFDRVAAADVTAALIELRDVAARARAASAVRPRIKIDWRTRDRHAPLIVSAANPALRSTPTNSPHKTPVRSLSLTDHSTHASSHTPALAPAAAPDFPFPSEERKRMQVVTNRIDTLLQVALWKGRPNFSTSRPPASRENSDMSLYSSPISNQSFHYNNSSSNSTVIRSKFGRRGRIRSTADANLCHPDASFHSHNHCVSLQTPVPAAKYPPWHFSPIESPITPLRSRTLTSVPDGHSVMAMWRGSRVSVKIIRRNHSRFIREADYLYSLGLCPNIPSLLGAHWEQPPSHKKKHYYDPNAKLGYLVLEVANGISLDKLVRQSKLTDIVTKLRLFERIISALVFAQKLNPLATHQDLHPGNILLVPIQNDSSSSYSQSPSATDPAPIFASVYGSSPVEHPILVRSSTNSTVGTSTDVSLLNRSSQSSLMENSVIVDPVRSMNSPGSATDDSRNAVRSISHNLIRLPEHTAHYSKTAGPLEDVLDQTERIRESSSWSNGAPRDPLLNVSVESASKNLPPSSHHPGIVQIRSTSTVGTTVSPPMHSSSTASTIGEDDNVSNHSAAFTVKVMDFPPVDEAEGMRQKTTWEVNEALSGYCPPEKVTPQMRRRLKTRLERELERRKRIADAKIVHGVHEALFTEVDDVRCQTNGQHRGRNGRHRSEVSDMKRRVRNMSDLGYRTHSKYRQTPDSETYALFGGDDLDDFRMVDVDHCEVETDSLVEVELDNTGVCGRTRAKSEVSFEDRDSHHTWDGYSKLRHGNHGVSHGAMVASMKETSKYCESDQGKGSEAVGKIDVWSIGWLLFYMCTEQHPGRDVWARRCAITEHELGSLPVECRDIVKMCVERDIYKRPRLRDVKRVVDSRLQALMFMKGIRLLGNDRRSAFMLLDKAVGIQAISPESESNEKVVWNSSEVGDSKCEEVIGLNENTRAALAALPLVIVRRVEWEAAGLYFSLSEEEMQTLRRTLIRYKWSKGDVADGASAVRYLERHCSDGVSSAQSALGWVYRWGGGGIRKDVKRAMELWEKAVDSGKDAEACNGLGLLYHHGRGDVKVDGRRAQEYYEMSVDQGYPAAAVNLGVLLHDGAGGVTADGVAARKLYEMACRAGDGIAANNLGLLLHHGARGVDVNGAEARTAYEMAIVRNEQHHACRNLGELLWNGAQGVERDRQLAVDYFAMAMSRGDSSSRAMAMSRLRRLSAMARDELEASIKRDVENFTKTKKMLDRCDELLEQVRMFDHERDRGQRV